VRSLCKGIKLDKKKREIIKEQIEFLIDAMIETTQRANERNIMTDEEFNFLQKTITKALELCEDDMELYEWLTSTIELKVDNMSQI
jgi:hypothetical protein